MSTGPLAKPPAPGDSAGNIPGSTAMACRRILPFLPVLAALALAACQPRAPAADPPAPAAPDLPETASADFRCGDLLVGAVFDNVAGNVTLDLDTRRLVLPRAVSASGARYADEAGNEFWNRGDAAMLTLDGTPMPDCTVTTEVSPWDEARSRGVVFRGLGNEPFWSLEVGPGEAPDIRLALDAGERPLSVAGATALPGRAGWRGLADDGSEVELRVNRGDCSDGMSDRTYPAGIELQVGTETYTGCGAFLDE